MQRSAGPADKQTLAIISPTPTPYFTHFYRRIARELPGIRPLVIYSHLKPRWQVEPEPLFEQHVLGHGSLISDFSLKGKRRDWRLGGKVAKFLGQRNASAVYLTGYGTSDRWRVARWAARRGIPCLAWSDANARGESPHGWRLRAKRGYFRMLDRWVNAWLGCGSLSRAYYERYGISAANIFTSPVEPDYDAIDAIPEQDVECVREEMDLPPGPIRVICSGRLVRNKRFDVALRAFARAAAVRPEMELLVLGSGEEEPALRRLIPPELAPRVRWIGFLTNQRKVSCIYRCCDILLHTPDHEPWALVVNEAAAASMAMVCTDVVGAAAELVRDGINGRLIPKASVDAATTALLEMTRPSTLEECKAASRPILAEWRRRADPVEGLAEALQHAGVKEAADWSR